MAYFACGKAALTGTDQSTRISIAKGLVSPTYRDSQGNTRLRGVIQADIVGGRNTGYASGRTIQERIAAAGRQHTSSTGGTYVYADRARETVRTPPAAQIFGADLHESPPGVIKTSETFGLPFKTIGIIGAIGVVLYVVLKR